MTDLLNTCPRCGRAAGHCVHTTEGQVSIPIRPEPAVTPVAAVTCVGTAARGGADITTGSESFTKGLPFLVTADDLRKAWCGARDGRHFRCGLCGHRFQSGDVARWQYTNDMPQAGGNPFVCASCDNGFEGTRAKWAALCAEWRDAIDGKFWKFHRWLA